MRVLLSITNIMCIVLIAYYKKKKNHTNSTGEDLLLIFGVLFTICSLTVIQIPDITGYIIVSTFSLILYIVYIYTTKIFSDFSFSEIKEDILKKIQERKSRVKESDKSNSNKETPKNINNQNTSDLDYLIKLKELKDNNIITQKEFNKKKKELIYNDTKSNKNVKEKPKTKVSTVIGALFIVALICVFANSITNLDMPTFSNTSKTLLESYNIPQANIERIYSILEKCGYKTYFPSFTIEKSGNNEEIPGSIGFEIKNGQNIVGFIDIKDNEIDNIQYSDKILYKNGAVQHTLSEYIISDDEETEFIVKAQEDIKSVLKSPSTAKFPWYPDEWKMSKKDGSIIVQSYVDAQNSFGAITRSNFQITYTNGIVTSLIFDGEEYIK